MATPNSPEPPQENRSSVAINALSRVLSVIFLMLLLGIGGSYLDKWLGTSFWTVVGFVLGGAIAMVGLIYVVRAAEYDKKLNREKADRRDEI